MMMMMMRTMCQIFEKSKWYSRSFSKILFVDYQPKAKTHHDMCAFKVFSTLFCIVVVNVGRPKNLIRYFMRPNVSYDCLFRIFSSCFYYILFLIWFVCVSGVHFEAISCSASFLLHSYLNSRWRFLSVLFSLPLYYMLSLSCVFWCWFHFYLNLDH